MPSDSDNPMLDVPPLDVVGFLAVQRLSSNFKASMERAWLISKQDSLSMEVANLSGELEVVKSEMEELQAQVASLSTCRNSSWEALHQRSRELELLDSDSTVVTSLANSTSQEISHLQEEKQTLLRCSKELKAMIKDSLDRF
ncbi:hypothetical protein AMTR_s00004p00195250 [Amborella trichopoda]|uniref:Uncharacterized protein n=1 Tax=Amborella trichopoda TaxID=13333 RepID=W1NE79_AMBTC|nr:hypothetical protein AMTR_s00004p00195250 [Amborella trichopoda]